MIRKTIIILAATCLLMDAIGGEGINTTALFLLIFSLIIDALIYMRGDK